MRRPIRVNPIDSSRIDNAAGIHFSPYTTPMNSGAAIAAIAMIGSTKRAI